MSYAKQFWFVIVFDKSAPASFGCQFLSHMDLFPVFAFLVVLGETLIPEGAYRPWEHLICFIQNVKLAIEFPVKSWFLGVSLIFAFVENLLIELGLSVGPPQKPLARGRGAACWRLLGGSRVYIHIYIYICAYVYLYMSIGNTAGPSVRGAGGAVRRGPLSEGPAHGGRPARAIYRQYI